MNTNEYQQTYEKRNERIKETIDVLAEYDPSRLTDYGIQTEIADEHGLQSDRISYVIRTWFDLITWRHHNMLNPLDPNVVKHAYDDEVLRTLAADGGDGAVMQIGMTLDEVFRAIKLLPSDMGVNIYTQVLQQADQLNPTLIREALRNQ